MPLIKVKNNVQPSERRSDSLGAEDSGRTPENLQTRRDVRTGVMTSKLTFGTNLLSAIL